MDNPAKKAMVEAAQAMTSMIDRSKKAQEKFAQGASQHTLQKNRISALNIALSLVTQELAENDAAVQYTKADLENALAPLKSLISKSEKAKQKLTQGTWQHTMLGDNLNALYIALPLVSKALSEI